jgi:hypothetical protein
MRRCRLDVDNAGSHETKRIRDQFDKRPRWHIYFTSTAASLINQVAQEFVAISAMALNATISGSILAQPDACTVMAVALSGDSIRAWPSPR